MLFISFTLLVIIDDILISFNGLHPQNMQLISVTLFVLNDDKFNAFESPKTFYSYILHN